jgi:hypothetical protein
MFSKVLRSLVVVPVLVAMGTVAAAADTTGTGSNMTLTVPSSATLIAKVAVPVTIQIQCTGSIDLSSFYYIQGPYFSSNGAVTISQASGRTVNSATGYLSQSIACDGTTHSYPVSVLANAPFRNGQAAITASAGWSEYLWGCSYYFGCNSFSVQANASVQGPISLSG